jgi:hypothetical protein
MEFKSIPEILAQFSKHQKILALMLLLLTVIIITIAPSFISSITTDRTELVDKINHLEDRIKLIEAQNDTLEDRIRTEQRSCTDQMFGREQEFISMIDELRGQIISYKRQNNIVVEKRALVKMRTETNDENGLVLESSMPPPPEPVAPSRNNTNSALDQLLKKVDLMKSKVKKQ